MIKNPVKFFLFIIAFGLSANLTAQSKSSLEKKRKRLENDIAFARTILRKTDRQKKAHLHDLSALNQVIKQSVVLISVLKTEVDFTDSQLNVQTKHLAVLKEEKEREHARLKRMVVKSYKARKSTSILLFVMSAGSFRQAMKRIKYLRKISEYKKLVVGNLTEKTEDVAYNIAKLESIQFQKKSLLSAKEVESEKIINHQESKSKLVKKLSSKEKSLKKQIRRNEIAVSKLNARISRLIAREIAAAKKREQERKRKAEAARKAELARSKNKKEKETNPKSADKLIVAKPAAAKLSSNFTSNKGKLSWPVGKGYISQSFGVHPHPDLAGITLVNNGVDITTAPGSSAKAVFEGTVSAVLNIPGQQKALLINHGDYFTVYSRLITVDVKKGDKISLNQKLGTVWTDQEGKTVLQFQVWKGQVKQNPASWIAQ
jgi:murein hydrolase activator